jgi:hypothetical protein
VVLKIWSGNPNWDGGCDYAMVDLTPEVAALALGRIGTVREQQATDPELNESYFWDSHAAYFSLWVESGTQPDSGFEAAQVTTLDPRRPPGRPQGSGAGPRRFSGDGKLVGACRV